MRLRLGLAIIDSTCSWSQQNNLKAIARLLQDAGRIIERLELRLRALD